MKYSMLKEKVVNLIASILIALSFILVLQITVNAKIEKEDEIIAIIQQDNEDNPESTAYLVTDKYVSNVAPETSIETFRKNMEEGITVYENATKQKEVTDGIIKTGMVLEYNQNGRTFDISVLGDINGDGILNQIELTREIRDILETENWKIEKEIEKLAGDIERDKKIDEKDTEAIINYIVFGKLNIGEFELVEKPEIEVTGEDYEEDRYRGNVNVKIAEKNEKTKTQKTVYKVIGSEEKEYKTIDAQEELKIETDGVFKVTAYTYGIEGNKSKGNSVIIIREAPTYTVKYLPGTHGKFKEQEISGLHKGDMTPEFKGDILGNPGYKFAGWSEEISETVDGDKEYTANWEAIEYKIEYVLNGGSLGEETNPERYTIETESFTLNNPSKVGYTFGGWTEVNGGELKSVVTIEQGSIEDKTYIANWIPNPDTRYTVEIYEMNLNGEYIKINTEEKTGETDTDVSVNVISKEGFTYEENLSTPRGTISPDGTTVLKIYYSRNKYKITITGENGIESVIGDREYYYGEEVSIDAIVKPGYTWDKWTSDNDNIPESTDKEYKIPMPIGDTTITPNTKLNKYEITYDLTGGNLVEGVENKTEYTVETETFTLNNPTKTGYTFIGWTGSNGESPETAVTIEKGSIGNKTYKANWKANTDTAYKIEIYQMNLNEEYVKTEERQKTGETDKIAKVVPEIKEGFTYEPSLSKVEANIAPDGSTILTVYYKRNKYTVTLEKGAGIENVNGAESYYYGATVTVNAEVKPGYTWNKWTSNSQKVSESTNKEYTITMPAEDITLTAGAKINIYTITYDLTGGILPEEVTNPNKYSVEMPDIVLNNPLKTGYTFIGWTGSNGESPETTVTIAKGSIGNKTYKANWIANTDTKYIVETYEMNLSGEYIKVNTEEKVGETDKEVSADIITKEGFTYEETISTPSGIIAPDGSTVLKVYYSRNKYTVIISKGNGIESVTETENYYYGATVTIDAETKPGYTWSKWESNSEKVAESTDKEYTITVPAEDVTLIATATVNTYTITYDLAGGNLAEGIINKEEYTVETESFTLNNPSKVGYIFTGWTGSNGESPETTVTIAKGSIGNKTYKANWRESSGITYKEQTYEMDLSGNYVKAKEEEKDGTTGENINMSTTAREGFTYEEALSTPNGTILADGSAVLKVYYSRNKYTVTISKGNGIESVTETESYYYGATVTINAETKPGYTWSKWESNSEKVAESTDKEYTITVPAEDVTLIATATVNTYTITYDLAGGNLAEGIINKEEYTVETESFTLNNPSKVGYIFTGWTGSNGESPETTVTIAKGSIGNKTYKANWRESSGITYKEQTYEMDLSGNYVKAKEEEKDGTTGENINMSTTAREGFTYEEALSTPNGTILADGSAVLKVYYSRNKYTVTISKGNGIESVTETESYYYGATVTIDAETKPGYTWSKWESTSEKVAESADKEYTITVPAEDITLTATATVNIYTITYDLAGGNLPTGQINPVEYTVETESFTLNNPSKVGYTFIGWTGSNGEQPETIVRIEQGSIGNKTYVANWIVNEYTLSINPNGGQWNGETTNSTITQNYGTTKIVPPPTRKGYTFTGWTLTGKGAITKTTPITTANQTYTFGAGNSILTANWTINKYILSVVAENGGTVSGDSGEIDYETSVEVKAMAKAGYKFTGWYEGETKVSDLEDYTFNMPDNNRSLVAKFKTIPYTITYDLAGGSLETGKTNPVEYTVETETFTLNNPIKTGYTFTGWTGSNGETANTVITIEKGTTGNKSYTANWISNTDTAYKVEVYEMNLLGNYEKVSEVIKAGETNKTVSEDIVTKEGFKYEASLSTQTGIIKADGSTVLSMYYSRNKYILTVLQDTGIESVTGTGTYYYGASVKASVTVKNGYTWSKWVSSSTKISESTEKDYTIIIPAENVTLTAKATINTYTITYDLAGGNLATGKTNPVEYTVETESFTLNNPSKVGYTFIGWTGSNGEIEQITVTIAKGSTENKSYKANWKANTDTSYKIETYQMNLLGDYEKVSEVSKVGETDTTVSANIITKEGFTYEETLSTPSGTIAPDGSTVLKVYYSRNKYTLSITNGTGTENAIGAGTYYYGASIKASVTVKNGYTWNKWISSSTKISESTEKDYTITMPAEDVTLTAEATINKYTITYDLAGGVLETGKTNPVEYTVETESFTLNNPSKVGYTFIGWTGSNGETEQVTVTIAKGSTENRTYKANWKANTDTRYTVETYEMDLSGDYVKISTEEKAGETDTSVSIDVQTKEGFTYEEALSNVTGIISPNGDTVFKIYYSRNKYVLSVNHDNGISNVSGAGEYYYGANIVVDATVKPGYTWSTWTSSNTLLIADSTSKTYNITMPVGNVTLTAKTTIITYTITYDLTGGALPEGETNPTEYTVETDNIILNDPRKTGYTFIGWTGSNGTTANKTVTIAKGSTGNKTYTANWKESTGTQYTEQIYQMNLNGDYIKVKDEITEGTTGAGVSMSTVAPEGFTYEESLSVPTGTISADGSTVLKVYYSRNKYTLNVTSGTGIENVTGTGSYYYGASVPLSATVKNGYTWDKWTSSSTKISESTEKDYTITIPAEDVTLTAEATINTYTITYDLVGGMLETGKTNPVEYTVETDDITLNNPIKEGYTFTGWTGSNGATANKAVTIVKGSTGNKTYTANWTINKYTLSINPNGGSFNASTEISTFEQNYGTTKKIEVPIREGYTFAGWTLNGKGSITKDNPIDTKEQIYTYGAGDGTLTANWTINKYTLTRTAETGGTVSGSSGNLDYGTNCTIIATPSAGYKFAGWYEGSTKVSSDASYTFDMPSKDYTLVAKFTVIQYTITYDLVGENLATGKTNPVVYTVETESFTLNNPIKEGYTFAGWTGSNGKNPETTVTIAKGSTGNKTYTANWNINKYTLSINPNGGSYNESTTISTFEQNYETTRTIEVPTREGYTFAGWTLTGKGKITTNTPIATMEQVYTYGAGDGTLIANWSINEYTLTRKAETGGTVSGSSGNLDYGTSCTIIATPSAGYNFAGWYEGSTRVSADASYTFNMPAKNYTLVAKFTAIQYTITYDLAGGSLAEGITNKEEYTVETESFTLNNPSKVGYTFIGWTGSNGTTANKTVTIAKGSTGNKTYTANWSKNSYTLTIHHYLENAGDNKYSKVAERTATLEYGSLITLADYKITVTYGTYSFGSLTCSDSATEEENAVTTTTMETGAEIALYYSRSKYELTLDKNEYILEVNGAGTYKVGQQVNISATLKIADTGYTNTFVKWTENDEEKYPDQEKEFTMPARDVTLKAIGTTTINKYPVTYIDKTQVTDESGNIVDKVLGSETKDKDYGTTVRGNELGSDSLTGTYYTGYYYVEDTQKVVTTEGATVYRIFKLHPTMSISINNSKVNLFDDITTEFITTVTATPGDTFNYKWEYCEDTSAENATYEPIGKTGSSYSIATTQMTENGLGTSYLGGYYKCTVTNAEGKTVDVTGTQTVLYTINSEDQMKNFAKRVNNQSITFKTLQNNGGEVSLINNVSINDPWETVGRNTTRTFKGTFNGNNKTVTFNNIKNLDSSRARSIWSG